MKTAFSIFVFLFLSISVFSQEAILKKKKGKYGFKLGYELVLDYQFDKAKKVDYNTYLVLKDDKLGLVYNGEIVLPCAYDGFDEIDPDVLYKKRKEYFIQQDGKYGLFKNNEILIPSLYDTIMLIGEKYYYSEEEGLRYYKVVENNKVGIYEDYKHVVPCQYESVKQTRGSNPVTLDFVVQKDKRYGFIKERELIIPCKYEKLNKIGEDFYVVNLENRSGVINSKNEMVLPFEYENVNSIYEGRATVKKDGEWKYLDIESNIYSDEEVSFFKVAEKMPLFDGDCVENEDEPIKQRHCSQKRMLEFLYGNMRYPAEARNKGVQGTAVIRFIIDAEGNVTQPEIFRDIGAGCGEEALRIVNSMPAWIPGEIDGEPVPVEFNLPVKFKLR